MADDRIDLIECFRVVGVLGGFQNVLGLVLIKFMAIPLMLK